MSTIRLLRDSQHAPCCFIIARAPFDARDEANTVLIQTDWDWPPVARVFGWDGLDNHPATDGTVNCPDTGKTATEFIAEAGQWLRENTGAEAEDPGYF